MDGKNSSRSPARQFGESPKQAAEKLGSAAPVGTCEQIKERGGDDAGVHRRRRATQRCDASATGPSGSCAGRLRQRCSSSTMRTGASRRRSASAQP